MKEVLKYIGLFVAVVVMVVLILFFNNDIGVYKSNIEKDARDSQNISDDWHVAKQTTETISAMIFYNESLRKHTVSIYVNRDGLSFGYFFRCGGSLGSTMESITEFHMDKYNERAYISMNKQRVNEVQIDNGKSIDTINIDSTKPFAFILPVNVGAVTFYDINGNIVESMPEQL